MKPDPHRTPGARLLIFVVLNGWSPLLANAPNLAICPERNGRIKQTDRHEPAVRAACGQCLWERTNALDNREPRLVSARVCHLTFLQDGYDSQLPGCWLNELGDDTLAEGTPAERGGIVRLPDREDRLILSAGKTVRAVA